jgi:hypothetical protein
MLKPPHRPTAQPFFCVKDSHGVHLKPKLRLERGGGASMGRHASPEGLSAHAVAVGAEDEFRLRSTTCTPLAGACPGNEEPIIA